MNHSPRPRTDAPNHDDMNTPTRNMNVMEVTNPRPKMYTEVQRSIRHHENRQPKK